MSTAAHRERFLGRDEVRLDREGAPEILDGRLDGANPQAMKMKVIVHDIRHIGEDEEGFDWFVIDLAGGGVSRSYTVLMDPDCNSMEVAEDDQREFCEFFRRDIMIPGKLAELVGRMRDGGDVSFPFEVDNSPHVFDD